MIPRSWLPWLRLCRIAAVFSAVSNIAGGLAIAGRLSPWSVANTCLCLATCGLYLAGMVWNDYYDRAIDAVERPRRPIPSGAVPAERAWQLGWGLLLMGLFASAVAGWGESGAGGALLVAIPLALTIWGYDAGGKQTAAGPWLMGACRALNVLLGASLVAGGLLDVTGAARTETTAGMTQANWNPENLGSGLTAVAGPPTGSAMAAWMIAGALGLYVAGVTIFARDEAGQSDRRRLTGALLVLNLGLAGMAAWLVWGANPLGRGHRSLLALVLVAVVVNRDAWRAWIDPSPQRVQTGVRTMLSWIIVLDAVVVFHHHPDPRWAIAVASLLIPARLIGRRLAIT